MSGEKVLVGMSGGVDSAVCALLLKNKGFDVSGATLLMTEQTGESKDAKDAAHTAESLGFKHFTIPLEDKFRESVMCYFVNSYLYGHTPNPCVYCNKNMKFPGIISFAESLGINLVATGHYARIQKSNDRYLLMRSADDKKDQTYMLYALTQDILSKVLFPLGDFTKTDIRNFALENGIAVAEKKDSQDICFIKDGDYDGFIRTFSGKEIPEGNFCDMNGNIIGTHKGITGYTIGQRKGLGISSEEPYYVVGKNAKENRVILGRSGDLFSSRVYAENANFIPFDKLSAPMKLTAKLRYSQKSSSCTVSPTENGFVMEFDEPQRAVTPGQSAVLYDGDIVVGGGTISDI